MLRSMSEIEIWWSKWREFVKKCDLFVFSRGTDSNV